MVKGTTEEMEQSEAAEQEEAEQEQPDHDGDETQQQGDGSSDSLGPSLRRILPEIARLIPDGGKVKEHEAMNELRQKGVPSETIVDWSNQGYDVQTMNEALDQYQNSSETLPEERSQAKGDLGEIVAKPMVMEMYPPSQGYEYTQGVKLKRNVGNTDITKIDWVVSDSETGDVVAIYQVKSGVGKAGEAQDQLNDSKSEFKKVGLIILVILKGCTKTIS